MNVRTPPEKLQQAREARLGAAQAPIPRLHPVVWAVVGILSGLMIAVATSRGGAVVSPTTAETFLAVLGLFTIAYLWVDRRIQTKALRQRVETDIDALKAISARLERLSNQRGETGTDAER